MFRTKVNSLGIPEETKEKRDEFPFVITWEKRRVPFCNNISPKP